MIHMQSIRALRRLTVFRGLLQKQPLHSLLHDEGFADKNEIAAAWLHQLFSDDLLAASPEWHIARDPWEAWLIQAVLTDENRWTICAEHGNDPSPFIASLVASDLNLLSNARNSLRQLLFDLKIPIHDVSRPWDDVSIDPHRASRVQLVHQLVEENNWSEAMPAMARYLSEAMAGPFNLAYTFRYEHNRFSPILSPDPVTLDDLTGYDKERQRVIANTERMLQGLPAHNMLLYGDRGTGKSATVKALIHRYGDAGLRLIEVAKSSLHEVPTVLRALAKRAVRTILFFDDLSFEDSETEYKELKAALEGSLELMANHVRIYATTNRRHLVTERFADRRGGAFGTAAEEVRSQDGVQEKLSLSDRFGQTVIFPTPSQQAYLDIVFALAKQHDIAMPEDELTTAALRWATWQNGRSARTARQFIDGLIRVSDR